ncbi:MAG TPA: LptF/LptG family permease [candidate division Zixibacteria bacterium]|nr:LptF/LptG family permease [candidate division Zixibacteria bacterium]
MKILTRYILREHIGPFIFAFLTITFLLVIDLVPKIVDNVIDKDLELSVVLELIALNLAWMLALSVPMSVLVATLMAFGRLGGDFEITAIKASGINLLRVIFPLMIAAGVIMVGMIQFNDRILPDLNKRARLLWGDISAMRPTLVFRSGAFITDLPGFLVLIDKIDHTTSRVEGVHITETKDREKPRIITAKYGFLEMTEHNTNMRFTLYNGEIHSLDLKDPANYRRVDFQNYVINVSDARDELVRSESEHRNDREMGIADMQAKVDAAAESMNPFREQINSSIAARVDLILSDTLIYNGPETDDSTQAYQHVRDQAALLSRLVERSETHIQGQAKTVSKYDLEIYKKYALPAASVAFILIGAPLGIMARKGGMGVAIAISIVLFILYWAFLIGGEDLADRRLMSPFWAMWAANFLMSAIGLYLIFIVVTERPLLLFSNIKK